MAEASDWRGGAILSIVSMAWLCGVPAWAKYGGGSGTASEPYLIGTAEHLDALGTDPNDWDKSFKLAADIDLSAYPGNTFHPIGSRWGPGGIHPFSGVFDGNGHTITGFSYSTQETYPVGLFIYVAGDYTKGNKAEVKSLHLVAPRIDAPKAMRVGALVGSCGGRVVDCSALDVAVSGYEDVGGLIGENDHGMIQDCSCTGNVAGNNFTGGLVGATKAGIITACRFDGVVKGGIAGGMVGWNEGDIISCGTTGQVTGSREAGGLVGSNFQGTIVTCWSEASVQGAGDNTGGLVGELYAGTAKSCWASGAVEGNRYVGGFVGKSSGTISYCYATGAVKGDTYIGGFAGTCAGATRWSYSTGMVSGATNVGGFAGGGSPYLCYWDIETSGIAQPGAGWGRTTAQMMSAATFVGWGVEGQWVLDEGRSYPRLVWEKTPGQLLVDAPRTYGGGTGTPDDPYLIGTPEELSLVACHPEDLAKHFRLAKDIDLQNVSTREFIPLGASLPFTGSFDGSGHTIYNFHGRGLFGTVAGSIRDLHLSGAMVSGGQAGALAASNRGVIQGCSVTGEVTGTRNVGGLVGSNVGKLEACAAAVQVSGGICVGGLAGYNGGSISACSAAGRVTGPTSCGGLVGSNYKDINTSCSTAEVTGGTEVGGLVGTAGEAGFWTACPAPPPHFVPTLGDSRITACYSLGRVTGRTSVGGLIGKNAGVIMACYAASPLQVTAAQPQAGESANTDIGGLVGKNEYGIVYLSYWDTEVSGLVRSAGGKGRTTAQMTTAETFRGWSAAPVWALREGSSYPYFARTGPGLLITDDPQRYGGGDGTPAAPYQLWTAAHLANLGYYPGDWDKHFVLMSDIKMADIDPNMLWPIGILSAPFTGTFDGNGHTVAQFSRHADSELYIGLFGSIGRDSSAPTAHAGEVSGLTLQDLDVSGRCYVGGLAGHSDGVISSCSGSGQVRAVEKNAGGLVGFNAGVLRDCSNTCTVTAYQVGGTLAGFNTGTATSCSGSGVVKTAGQRDSCAGGLIGENSGTVERCHFRGDVLGKQWLEESGRAGQDAGGWTGGYTVGGLVALNEGTISQCSAQATVIGSYLLGGLVGYNEYVGKVSQSFAETAVIGGNTAGGLVGDNNGQILDCFATGQVGGNDRIGGLVGENYQQREIQRCYSTCRVAGRDFVGGFLGAISTWDKTNVVSCFWDVDSSGTSDGVGSMDPDPNGVLGLPTSALHKATTFMSAGWSFSPGADGAEPVWWIREGQDYPRLRWELDSDANNIASNLPGWLTRPDELRAHTRDEARLARE
jgi:hypothetical protein